MHKISLKKFEALEADGYMARQPHKRKPLWVWNYTRKAQWGKVWTPETLMARGLVTDHSGKIVARPFKKFFNLGEHEEATVPTTPYYAFSKLDGSLGVLFNYDDEWELCTRGSFESDQAKEARKIIKESATYNAYLGMLRKDFTYLFEIIYPENRIVLDYHGERKLVLIGIIHTDGGWEIFPSHDVWPDVAPYLDKQRSDPADLVKLQKDNEEGFVLYYPSEKNLRIKVKFEEYLRLHRIVTGINAKDIWRELAKDGDFKEILDRVPDEFYAWVNKTIDKLRADAFTIILNAQEDYIYRPISVGLDEREDRAAFAEFAKTKANMNILFRMYSNQPFMDLVWKLVEPRGDVRPFSNDQEG